VQTIEEATAERLTEQLTAYRGFVERAADGEQIFGDELNRVVTLLEHLGLPGFAWDRDVEAVRQSRSLDKQLAEVLMQEPAERQEAEALTKEIEQIQRRLGEAKARLHQITHSRGSLQAGLRQRQAELDINHPHLFRTVAAAVEMRMAVARKRAEVASQRKVGWLP
jgi:predicted  nucleic acid-binding Zn-ribbon protein